ncbi:MAG: tetratricopeptide repeat protein [Solirubrobacteraceae bacterium]
MTDPLTQEDCWHEALASKHPDLRAETELQLGVHYAAQGQTEAAGRAFAAVDPDANRVAAARASLRLHRLLIAADEVVPAWDALARATELSDPRRSPDVELQLGARAAALGLRDEAARRYQAVLSARTHRDRFGALAAYRLAELQSEQGARDKALVLWRLALQGSDENLRPHVLIRLADALRRRQEDGEAEDLYEQVIATDHPDLAPRAALALANVMERREALSPALKLYAVASASGHRDVAETADLRRQVLLRRRTRAALDQVQRTGVPHHDGPDRDDDNGARWHPWRKVRLDRILGRWKAASKDKRSDPPDAMNSLALVFAKLAAGEGSVSIWLDSLIDEKACFGELLERMDVLTTVDEETVSRIDYVIHQSQLPAAQNDQAIRSVLLAVQSKWGQRDRPWSPHCPASPTKDHAISPRPMSLAGHGQSCPLERSGAPSHLLLLRYAQAMAVMVRANWTATDDAVRLMSGALAYGLIDCDATDHDDRACTGGPSCLLGGSRRRAHRSPDLPT